MVAAGQSDSIIDCIFAHTYVLLKVDCVLTGAKQYFSLHVEISVDNVIQNFVLQI